MPCQGVEADTFQLVYEQLNIPLTSSESSLAAVSGGF
jgi:hypothetical protein